MAWELLTSTPALLREGHYIFFTGGWPSATGKDNRWFQVERAQAIKYDVNRNVAAAASIDLDFVVPAAGGVAELSLSLMPQSQDSLYELLLGIKGNPLVYPMYNNSYYLKLEATNVVPDTAGERLRYLGFYDEDDSPMTMPRLRDHVTKDQQPPVLRVYNDMFVEERIVLRFIVNRLKLMEVGPPPEDIQRVARIAKYHSWYIY